MLDLSVAGNKSCPCTRQDVMAIRRIPNLSINQRFWFVLCNHYKLVMTHFHTGEYIISTRSLTITDIAAVFTQRKPTAEL
jgi:hypothetical protein